MFKRKGGFNKAPAGKRAPARRADSDEESIASDDENLELPVSGSESEQDNFFEESVDEKRVRLAKQYLQEVKDSVKRKKDESMVSEESDSGSSGGSESGSSDSEDDSDVDARLRHDVKLRKQQVKHAVADSFYFESQKFLKGHLSAPTSVRVSEDESKVATCGKDGAVIVWDVESGKKQIIETKEAAPLYAVEWTSPTVLVCGGEDRAIKVIDVSAGKVVKYMRSHQGRVTGLRYQPEPSSRSNELSSHSVQEDITYSSHNPGKLYSIGSDKSLKSWLFKGINGSYQESYFGHTGECLSLDCFEFDRPVTGGYDQTCRYWNISNDSHMAFNNGHTGPVESVVALDSKHFLTGDQEGGLCVWGSSYKKPMVKTTIDDLTARENRSSKWISSVGALRNSDLAVVGGSDGLMRFFKIAKPEVPTKKQKIAMNYLDHLDVQIPGIINSIDVGKSGRVVAAAVGRDARLGRWLTVPQAKNGLWIGKANHECQDLLKPRY